MAMLQMDVHPNVVLACLAQMGNVPATVTQWALLRSTLPTERMRHHKMVLKVDLSLATPKVTI